jgi:hypothetical protein
MTLSFEAQDVVRAAREAYGPTFADRSRVRQRLIARLAGLAVVTSGTKAAAALGSLFASKAAVLSVVTMVVGGGISAAVWQHERAIEEHRHSSVMRPVAATHSASAVSAPATMLGKPSTVLESAFAPKPDNRGSSVRAMRTSPNPNVQGEVKLLSEAQRALADGQPGRAISLLDQHAREFPQGALTEERKAAHVIALCKLGRTAGAQAEANAFFAKSPHSPLRRRLRETCGNSVVPDEPKE